MLLQTRRASRGRLYSCFVFALTVAVAASACDKAPLLAPGGTVIRLSASANSVSSNGEVSIVAVLLEQGTAPSGDDTDSTTAASGTPVHNGTLVTFTTTIGRIEPAEARTTNGAVTVRYIPGGASGVATILAYSGGASTTMTLNVGGAAAERILLSATPLSSSGGTSTVTAKVEDTSGNPLSGVSVQFSATRGSLSSTSATTNDAGVATVTLNSTVESAVTATVGSKTASVTVTPATRSGLTITPPTTITASSPAVFTVGVASGSGVSKVVVNWGDGSSTNLGAVSSSASPQHVYSSGGTYNVTATATMSDGSKEDPVTAPVSVGEFGVSISTTNNNPSATQSVTFTGATTPNTTQVDQYHWDFGDGTSTSTTGPNVSKSYAASGNYTVTLTVEPVKGGSRSAKTTIVVS